MAIHRKLAGYSKAKHVKAFNKYLKTVEEDLVKLGARDFEVEVISFDGQRSVLRRIAYVLIASGYGDPEEAMIISAVVHDCPVEIAVPMGKGKVAMPYLIEVILPQSMTGRAEFRRGRLGSKWHVEPKDRERAADLKRSIPNAKLKQDQASKGLEYLVKVGHTLEPSDGGGTEWTIHSGYEGSMFSGGYRPRVRRYLEAIPAVQAMLSKWGGR